MRIPKLGPFRSTTKPSSKEKDGQAAHIKKGRVSSAGVVKEEEEVVVSEKTPLVTSSASPPTVPAVVSHTSLPIRIHNRSGTDLLLVSSVAALPAISSIVTTSSIDPTQTKSGGPGAAFSIRNTPLLVPAKKFTDVPCTQLEPSTAASKNGYHINLTLAAKGATLASGVTANIAAPPPSPSPSSSSSSSSPTGQTQTQTQNQSTPSTSVTNANLAGRRWKKLDLPSVASNSPSSGSLGNSLYALQSIPTTTSTSGSAAEEVVHILLFSTRSGADWMRWLPDSDALSSFCIPGTHESAALFGWPISSCQESSSSINSQLVSGIRFLDIRLSLKGDTPTTQTLMAYHGVTDQKILFSAICTQVYDFLTSHPTESVIMSVKQENDVAGFQQKVFEDHISKNPNFWYLGTNIPTLAQTRGKIILVSRFAKSNEQPGGIHPIIWPDSSPTIFNYDLPPTSNNNDNNGMQTQKVYTQDWYNIGSLSAISTKLALIQQLLDVVGNDETNLGLNFTSASSFPFALPPLVAKGLGDQNIPLPTSSSTTATTKKCLQVLGLNSLLVDFLADRLRLDHQNLVAGKKIKRSGLMTIFALDFFNQPNLGASLASLLIEANFD